jgi:hypothetical protein
MANPEDAAPVGLAGDVLKAAKDLLLSKSGQGKETKSYGGPLLVIGRLYISLTLILAATASVAAYLDAHCVVGHAPSEGVETLRCMVAASVLVGLALGVALIIWIVCKNALLLFSPTELSAETQRAVFIPHSKPDQPKVPPPPSIGQAAPPEAKAGSG